MAALMLSHALFSAASVGSKHSKASIIGPFDLFRKEACGKFPASLVIRHTFTTFSMPSAAVCAWALYGFVCITTHS